MRGDCAEGGDNLTASEQERAPDQQSDLDLAQFRCTGELHDLPVDAIADGRRATQFGRYTVTLGPDKSLLQDKRHMCLKECLIFLRQMRHQHVSM